MPTDLDWVNAMLALLTPAAIALVLWDAHATRKERNGTK